MGEIDKQYSTLEKKLIQTELLIEAAKSFTSSLRVEEIITKILDRSLQVIEAADAGALFLYDKESNALHATACAGFQWEELRNVTLSLGESMTGYTFLTKQPKIYEQARDVHQGMLSMKPQNKQFYDQSLERIRGVLNGQVLRSVMCTPLIMKDECIGVITIDNFSSDVSFSEDDLQLLVTLANQATIALENARLYQEERSRREKLEELNQLIQVQHDQLYHITQAHQTLMKQVLSGSDIEHMATAIHEILNNPILIYDPLLRLIAEYGGHEVNSEIPPFLADLQKVLHHWKPKKIVPSLQVPIPYPVTLLPIVASNQLLGILAILESNQEFNDSDTVLAEQCGIVLALDLLKREAVYEARQRLKGEFLQDLQSEKNIEILKERIKSMGLSADDAYLFMVIDWSLEGKTSLKIDQIQKSFEKDVLSRNPHSLIVSRFNHSVILMSWPKKVENHQIIHRSRSLAQAVADTIKRIYPQAHCSFAISQVCRNLENLLHSYEEAKQTMDFIRSQKEKDVIRDFTEMGAVRFILDQPKEELMKYVTELLDPLLAYPSQKRKELLKALDAFMIYGRSLKEAAASIGIQSNTLTYRLKRIEEILGFSIDDYSTYFNLSFAWKVLETYGLKNKYVE